MTPQQVQATADQIAAQLIEFERALERVDGMNGAPRNLASARAFVGEVRRKARQNELAGQLVEGDCVNIKHKGHGTFHGFIKHEPGKMLIEREGYGRGWYDVDDIDVVPLADLDRYVAICENGSKRDGDARRGYAWDQRREQVAAWRAQVVRRQIAEVA